MVGPREKVNAAPNDYLRELRRFKDPEMAMTAEGSAALPGGRRVSVWRFLSRDWGHHLYARITEGSTVIDVEAFDRGAAEDVAALRRIL
jgi:hypothetical protein